MKPIVTFLLLSSACRAMGGDAAPGAEIQNPSNGRVQVEDGEALLEVAFWGLADGTRPAVLFETTYTRGSIRGVIGSETPGALPLQCSHMDGDRLCTARVPIQWLYACGEPSGMSSELGAPLGTAFSAHVADPFKDNPTTDAFAANWLDVTEDLPLEVDVDRLRAAGLVDLLITTTP